MRNEQSFREITDDNSPHGNWQRRRQQFPPNDASHIDSLGPLFNLLQAEECAYAGTRANVADFLPSGFAGKVRVPKRPRPALDGPRRVDSTFATC